MPNKPTPLPPNSNEGDRIDDLVVCRESALYDNVLMEGMIAQTLGRLSHLPGASDVLSAGITPLTGGSPFATFPMRRSKTNAVLFEHEGTIYLYSLGSAATASGNSPQENAFVEILIEVIEQYHPRRMHVATFSRLVRAMEFSGRLYQAVSSGVDEIYCGETVIRPETTEGKIMWNVLALVADMERTWIVQRLFAGLCAGYRRGDWVFSASALPPGYALTEDKRIVIDESQVDGVRTMLLMMADPAFTTRDIMDEAGRLGVSTPTTRRFHGPDATFGDLRRSDSRIASLVDWLPTYLTGVIEMYHRNPFPRADQVAGLEVVNATLEDPGQVCFRYTVDLPEGGWLTEEVMKAAQRLRRGRKDPPKTGGAKKQQRKPLAGAAWTQNGCDYRLSGDSDRYLVLRSIPLNELAGEE